MNTPEKHRSALCALSFRTWAGNHPLVLAGALVGAILPTTPPASAQSHTWTGGNPDNTFWSQGYVDHAPLGVVGPEDEPSNWNVNDAPNGAPNTPGGPEDTVLIAVSPPTSMNVSAAVGAVTVQAPGVLDILGGHTLSLREGDLTNNSTITINSEGSGANAGIAFDGAPTPPFSFSLLGSGTVILNGATSSDATFTTDGDDSLTHAATHTIRGAGGVNVTMTNNGVVESAVSPSGFTMLVINSSPIHNNHILRATAGSRLLLSGLTAVTQDPATGRLLAEGTGAAVSFRNASLEDGRLESSGGGTVEVGPGGATLASVTNAADVNVLATHTLTVTGSGLVNNGAVTIDSDGLSGVGAALIFSDGNPGTTGTLALAGSGVVTLNASTSVSTAQIQSGDGGDGFVQASTHTIRGAGAISAAFTNNGVIESAPSSTAFALLHLNTAPKVNNAVLRATANSHLRLAGGVSLTQDPATGRIIADGSGAKVRLENASVAGGRLETGNGGVIEVELGGATLTDVVNQGFVALLGNHDLTISGAGLGNNGEIVINADAANSTTILQFDDGSSALSTGFVLSGSGVIDLNAFNGAGDAQVITGTLDSLIQQAGHSIRGAGQIAGTFVNQGVVESAPATSGFKTLSFGTGSYGNSGTFRATNDTTFQIPSADTRLANYDALTDTLATGRFEVIDDGAGATMNLVNAPISVNEATIVLDGPGSVFTQLASLAVNHGTFALRGGRVFAAAGSFTNTGTVELGPGSTLSASATFTQSGSALRVGVSGPGSDTANYGRVTAGTGATVGGRLDVVFNFPAAANGMTWDVVTTGGVRTGTFSEVRVTGLPQALSVLTHYLANAVRIELVAAAASYSFWAAGQGFASPAEAQPDADANHNGLSNLADYALGLNAATPGPGPVISSGKVSEEDLEFLILVYRRPGGANKPTDVLYVPRGSDTLGTWSAAGLTETVSDIDTDGWERVTVRTPATARTRAFLRVELVPNP